MEPLPRLGGATRDILEALVTTQTPQWGLELIRKTGRPSGTVYPALDRLERAGWVESAWEDDDARKGPRRRLYRLRPDAVVEARRLLQARASTAGALRQHPRAAG